MSEEPHVIDIDVHIEGASDRTVADAIRQRVRRVHQQIARPGEWRVPVLAFETRGQWDLAMRPVASVLTRVPPTLTTRLFIGVDLVRRRSAQAPASQRRVAEIR